MPVARKDPNTVERDEYIARVMAALGTVSRSDRFAQELTGAASKAP